MMPKTHILSGIVASSVLYSVFDVSFIAALFFLKASVLIDVDHYLFYVWRKKDFHLGRAFDWFIEKKKVFEKLVRLERKKVMNAWFFLHGLESVLIFGLLGFFIWDVFYFVALGFLFHLVLDWIDLVKKIGRADKISCIWDLFKFRKLRKI